VFAVVALVLRGPIEDELLGGSSALYTILIVAVLAYAASYFARGFLAGHHRFGLYGGLVFMEATSRFMFALAVALSIAEGQTAVALGIAAAPIVSLAVVPWALGRRLRAQPPVEAAAGDSEDEGAFTLAHGSGFAVAVLLIMLSEQTFLNAGPLLVKANEGARGAALAGFTFNVLLIARAPLQLFQAIQTSILPHLTRLRASGETDPFRRSVNVTLMAIAGFAGCVALVMLAIGPWVMDVLFGGNFDYGRWGLVLVSIGMGLYLSAATLNQALLAHGRAQQSCLAWVGCAVTLALFLLLADFDDPVLQVELAFVGAAATLCTLLWLLYRRA
jgi:O-antigen/teichoic acid export membrane protein